MEAKLPAWQDTTMGKYKSTPPEMLQTEPACLNAVWLLMSMLVLSQDLTDQMRNANNESQTASPRTPSIVSKYASNATM